MTSLLTLGHSVGGDDSEGFGVERVQELSRKHNAMAGEVVWRENENVWWVIT